MDEQNRNSASNIEKAYRGIKRLMLNQQLIPGQRLLYRALTSQLGMSKTPIVNALNRLEQEGFIISEPNVGYAVKPIDEKEIADSYEVREALEVKSVSKAIAGSSSGNLAVLQKKIEAFEAYQPGGYDKKKLMLDSEIHLQIAAMSGNEVLRYLLKRNFEHTLLRMTISNYPASRIKDSALEHQKLLKAIKEKDIPASVEIISTHIKRAGETVIACLMQNRKEKRDSESSFDF